MLKKIIKSILYGKKSNSEKYVKWLNSNGCSVGEGTYFFKPESVNIDESRLKYISIGKNCKITEGVSIIAHDYSWTTLIESNKDILPNGGKKITIGNNVFIGMKTMILKNVIIGDNVIIGASSVVTKNIPSNSVVAGNPARVICRIDELYKKNKDSFLENLLYEAIVFKNNNGRLPNIEETGYFMISFLERTIENWNKYFSKISFDGNDISLIEEIFYNTTPVFENYEKYCEYINKNI